MSRRWLALAVLLSVGVVLISSRINRAAEREPAADVQQQPAADTKPGSDASDSKAGAESKTNSADAGPTGREKDQADQSAAKKPTSAALPDYKQQIEPLLTKYCYDCHGNGEKKGEVALDKLKSDDQLYHNPELWFKALRNVRANIMPPAGSERPSADERELLAQWVKFKALGIDPNKPDPGRVTLRRLNRAEYRNTIRDLMGYDFKANEEFPSDDTGYGFDNIGDVLTVSPMLLEKYLKAADAIVTAAVMTEARTTPEKNIVGGEMRRPGGRFGGGGAPPAPMSFYTAGKAPFTFEARHAGAYQVILEFNIHGQFDFDPGRAKISFNDEEERLNEEYGWNENKKFHFEFDEEWDEGKHDLTLELEPLTPAKKRINSLNLEIVSVKVVGPLEEQYSIPAAGYDRFFTKAVPPSDPVERTAYARELLGNFARKAYRRPVDDATLNRLLAIAEETYSHPNKKFEEGIQRAMIAILASPRFLFRVETVDPEHADEKYPSIDEYSLASRLSYFLWSSMPDAELFRLAENHELRKNLSAQVDRMLKDPRSEELVQNFVGQWLEVRDVEGMPINEQAVTAREDEELQKLLEKVQKATNELDRRAAARALRFRNAPKVELNGELRRAMQDEVDMLFAYLLHENRSVDELIDSDYAFLNERLAQHYGIPDVKGPQMRRVTLPKDSPRGGVLTSGAVLVVTSNPDRTSPVKRGLFILDNITGSPTPPPPANVPDLEASSGQFKDHQPSLRELLTAHRDQALCASCHARLDPLGLGFENFNALGMWREKERGQPIEPIGELVTGESFQGPKDLKRIILENYKSDFYRCLTEKLFTYALGRGLTYNDVQAVDQIVDRLEQEDGHTQALVKGIIESPEFQRRRSQNLTAGSGETKASP